MCLKKNGLKVAIHEDLFEVINTCRIQLGHAKTAHSHWLNLKDVWHGITEEYVQVLLNLCPVCQSNTKKIVAKQVPLKMILSPTIGHRTQVDLIDMISRETKGGYKWILRYVDHHSGKSDVRASKDKTAAHIAPIIIRIMASTLVPCILQSDNRGEFLGETVAAVNR